MAHTLPRIQGGCGEDYVRLIARPPQPLTGCDGELFQEPATMPSPLTA